MAYYIESFGLTALKLAIIKLLFTMIDSLCLMFSESFHLVTLLKFSVATSFLPLPLSDEVGWYILKDQYWLSSLSIQNWRLSLNCTILYKDFLCFSYIQVTKRPTVSLCSDVIVVPVDPTIARAVEVLLRYTYYLRIIWGIRPKYFDITPSLYVPPHVPGVLFEEQM